MHVGGNHDGALKVWVTASPEKGRANKAIIQALTEALGIRKSQIVLISGDTHRRKLFEVGVARDTLQRILDRLLQDSERP